MSEGLVILDGFHAVKHALRFGAQMVDLLATQGSDWRRLAQDLAPDVTDAMSARVRVVGPDEFARWSTQRHPTGMVGVARRPHHVVAPEADANRNAPAVLLENPRRPGNVGAAVRAAAAAGASGVAVSGDLDPWQPAAVRGSAGLHFALPVTWVVDAGALAGPVVVMDAEGEAIGPGVAVPGNALLVFGTEREGVSEALKRRSDLKLALPMRAGVSSLNLATSVAATLYAWRLAAQSND